MSTYNRGNDFRTGSHFARSRFKRTWVWATGGMALLLALPASLPTRTSLSAAEVSSSEGPNANHGDAPPPGEYWLAPGDRLSIMVFGQTDLSGDFVVDGAGQILLPLAGPVTVGGLTVVKAQQMIRQRFADGVLVEPTVSVRVAEYRPIVVVGDVKNPGSYPFRFGQSVKAAIGGAGGPGRANRADATVADYILADERVRLLETNRRGLLVRRARLLAQVNEATDFVLPQLVGLGGDKIGVSAIYAAENDIFQRYNQVHRSQIRMLEQQRPRLEAEIKAVVEQMDKERDRLGLAKERVAELDLYKRKGFVRNYELNDQQRDAARVEGEVARLEAQVAHLQQNKGDIDFRIGELKANYKRKLLSELEETEQRLREIGVTLSAAQELLAYRAGTEAIGSDEFRYATTVIRRRMRGAVTIKANDDTLVEPGDVIEVKRASKSSYEIMPTVERASTH